MTGMRIGVLDLGSNSFHLLVADYKASGDLRAVAREKINLRLGDVVARSGCFDDDTADDAVASVRDLRDAAVDSGASVVFGAATSAFRDATNGDDLLRRIEVETGVNVRLIEGSEEGRLVFEAVQQSVELAATPAVCLDLGGGSLEVAVGDQTSIQWATSLPLGVVRLKAQLLAKDPPSRVQQRRLRDHVAAVIADEAHKAVRSRPQLIVGAGGTFRSIARMVAAQRDSTIPASINEMVVERDELLELSERLLGLSAEERTKLPGVGRRRADLAPTGVLVVMAAMEAFGHDRITVAEWTLKEGLIIDAVAKATDPSWIDPSAPLTLALHHEVDLEHATTVSALASSLVLAAAPLTGFSADDGRLLANAALLQEVGRRSAGDDSQHKAGARIVLEEMPDGYPSLRELACLVRFQNSGTPKTSYEPFRSLPPGRREVVAVLQAVLRVADWLAREDTVAKVGASPQGIEIAVPRTYSAASMWELTQRAKVLERLTGPVGIRREAEDLELVVSDRS